LRQIKENMVGLPLEEKIVYSGALLTVLGTFLPWFSFDQYKSFNGFESITWLLGLFVFLFGLSVFLPIFSPFFSRTNSYLIEKKLQIWLIAGGVILLMSLIAYSIYASFVWVKMETQIHSGLYIVIFSGLVILTGVVVDWIRSKKGYRVNVAKVDDTLPSDEQLERIIQTSRDEDGHLSE